MGSGRAARRRAAVPGMAAIASARGFRWRLMVALHVTAITFIRSPVRSLTILDGRISSQD